MNPKQSIQSINATMSVCTGELSCSLLLKLPMLEDNSAYLNFVVCRSIPSPLPIYFLFSFLTSSKTNSEMNFSIKECRGGRLKLGKTPLVKLSGNIFLPKAAAMFMIEPK